VSGLPAKDLIGLVAVIESDAELPEAISRLDAIGYEARGNLGGAGREAFWWPQGEKRHHLYVSAKTSEGKNDFIESALQGLEP
jgi:GrpB protein